MKSTKTFVIIVIIVILFFVPIANASICISKIENSFLNASIQENNLVKSSGYYFVFGKVDNVDTQSGGYDHCWEFHIIKALVISEEKPIIRMYNDTWIITTYDGFLGFLGDNFVCAFMVWCNPI